MKSNELLLDTFGRIRETVAEALGCVDDEALVHQPTGNGNSMAWLIWHLGRVENAQVGAAVGLEQVWTSQGVACRFNLPLSERDTGYAHLTHQLDAVRAPRHLLREYYDAVHGQTVHFLNTVDDEALDRIVDPRWDRPPTLGGRLVRTIAGCLQYVGQAAYAKGLKTTQAYG
ncbi:mycothiol transferase [Pseudarthrobacter sp. N5]|uniref:mycothiol transferase n=1 Tax=Pseudarthrobacter sp. N5 TaxID=3418416 RepID=UPI003CF274C0